MAEMPLSLQRAHGLPGAGAGAEGCLAAGNIIAPRSTPGAGHSTDLAKGWLSDSLNGRMFVGPRRIGAAGNSVAQLSNYQIKISISELRDLVSWRGSGTPQNTPKGTETGSQGDPRRPQLQKKTTRGPTCQNTKTHENIAFETSTIFRVLPQIPPFPPAPQILIVRCVALIRHLVETLKYQNVLY